MPTDQMELNNRQRRRGGRYYNPQGIGMLPQGGSDYYQRRNTEVEQGLMPTAQSDAAQAAGAALRAHPRLDCCKQKGDEEHALGFI